MIVLLNSKHLFWLWITTPLRIMNSDPTVSLWINQSIRVSCQILTLATIKSSSLLLQLLTNSRDGIPVALCSHPRYVRRCRPRDLFPAIRPVKASSPSCSFLDIWPKKRRIAIVNSDPYYFFLLVTLYFNNEQSDPEYRPFIPIMSSVPYIWILDLLSNHE